MKKLIIQVSLAALAVAGFTACDNKAKQLAVNGEETATTTPATSAEQPMQPVANTNAADAPVMEFENKEYDFGTIKEGDIVKYTYKFTNTGKSPLIIQSATAQCGCTVPQKPDKPVGPGETSEIKVEFNSQGKVGIQSKAITIVANTQPESTILTLKGIVNADAVSSMQGPVRAN